MSAIKLVESAALTEPLVVFRGDHVYQAGMVLSLIEKLQLLVWVMGDLDPKGLSIAQSYSDFAGLMAPDMVILVVHLNDPGKINHTLYANQLAGCRNALSDSYYPFIKTCWQLMKQHQAGTAQEHWAIGKHDAKNALSLSRSVKT